MGFNTGNDISQKKDFMFDDWEGKGYVKGRNFVNK